MARRLAEYIWTDREGRIRSKTKTLALTEEPPEWAFDGSCTGQAPLDRSDVTLSPVYICRDPLRDLHDRLVLCATYDANGVPLSAFDAEHKSARDCDHLEAWFGFEQEYYLVDAEGSPGDKGGYCLPDLENMRDFVYEEHLRACLVARLDLAGANAEASPGQFEFQIGPVAGILGAHQLLVARYLLQCIATRNGLTVDFRPKPFPEQAGSGCHVNFSVAQSRQQGGLGWLTRMCQTLEAHHAADARLGGPGNLERLTECAETSSSARFTVGVADRTASVRIPGAVHEARAGYLEDRRPGASVDPYVYVGLLCRRAAEADRAT